MVSSAVVLESWIPDSCKWTYNVSIPHAFGQQLFSNYTPAASQLLREPLWVQERDGWAGDKAREDARSHLLGTRINYVMPS